MILCENPQKFDHEYISNSLKRIIGEEEYKDLYERHKMNREALAFQRDKWYGNNINIESSVKEMILNFEIEILNEKKSLLQPLNDDNEKLIKFNNISKRI